jgi:hypothetical protein
MKIEYLGEDANANFPLKIYVSQLHTIGLLLDQIAKYGKIPLFLSPTVVCSLFNLLLGQRNEIKFIHSKI